MIDNVRMERVTSHPLAVVRRRVASTELSRFVPEACGLVWKTLRDAQVQDAGRQLAIYRRAADNLLDVEVGVEVSSAFPGHGEVGGSLTPAGNTATVKHFGPYSGLGEAHQAIRQWCTAAGRTLAGPYWEIYGHWLERWNRDPSQIRTDVFYLLMD